MQPTDAPPAKQQVISWVRKANPQTMELKEGCVVAQRDGGCEYLVLSVVQPDMGHGESYVELFPIHGFCPRNTNTTMSSDPKDCRIAGYLLKRVRWGGFLGNYHIRGSDMGLQEFCIAIMPVVKKMFPDSREERSLLMMKILEDFDYGENLHNQTPEFYEDLLPLFPTL